ncbi:MAG: transglutaminase-like domain-containing protein [Fimbriimonadaceae bacterium]|nr:transglutaminase-like domain-containing protein [Fimbriimonadaceae bacterium]
MALKRLLPFLLVFTATLARAEESWMGIYLQGNKLGYASYRTSPEGLDGKPGSRTDSTTVLSSKMLGAALAMKITSTTWLDPKGAPIRMKFLTESSDRSQTLLADFSVNQIKVQIDNNGAKSSKTLPIPAGAKIVDDATSAFMVGDRPPVGKSMDFYVLDPTTVSLIKNTAVYRGKMQTEVREKQTDAEMIEIQDPRATTKVFMSSKGDLLKIEGPLGMVMLPETKDEALAEADASKPKADLAFATAINTTPRIERASSLKRLRLDISGLSLERLPSDPHQTVQRSGSSWIIDVHPVAPTVSSKTTIAAAAKNREVWIKPAMHMPSSGAEFKSLAKRIIGSDKSLLGATQKVRDHVHSIMSPNAGIGVLRDASEVLKTKEGVCRDYAILTATLLRAAGIPARLCSGLLAEQGQLFYHAWVEVWTGREWIGVDSTRAERAFSAAHIKLAQGNVEEAFTFFVLDGAKVKVLETKY